MTPSQNGAESALPEDLAALERRLVERSPLAPPGELRQRVLAAVRRERNARTQRSGGRLPWQWLAASAAAVLMAINFSTSLVNNLDWRLAAAVEPAPMSAIVERVQGLAPDWSPSDVRRQALLLRAGARPAPGPYGRTSLIRILHQRETESWDMH